MVGEARYHGADALVEERHGRGAVNQIGKGLHQLLPQSRLERSQCAKLCGRRERNQIGVWHMGVCGNHSHSHTHQLDDLDEHPVVGGAGHELEEGWSEGEVVPRVLPSQLTDHAHGC